MPMKTAALQMVSTPEVARNLQAAERLLSEAAAQGAELAVLPEYFCLLGQRDGDKLAVAEAPGSGPIQEFLADCARRLGLFIVGGTLPIRTAAADGTPRALNRSIVYGPSGQALAHYDKIHLFAFDNGRERYDEGRSLLAGDQPVAVNLDASNGAREGASLRVGLSICYDLRFPELYRQLMALPGQGPCDVLVVPSAFTHTTGLAHWQVLLRARAIENQCYVLAAAQGGLHENGRRTFGHSLIVDPWGEVLGCREEGEGVVLAECSAQRLHAVRQQLPALAHRRISA
jgi:deaminated glutathione amidase